MRVLVLSLLVACGAEAPTDAAPEAPAAEVAAAPKAEKQAKKKAKTKVAAAATEGEASAAAAPDQAVWKTFGQPFTVVDTLPAKDVFADPSAHAEKPVRLEGELTQVCQKAGCWAVVRDGAGQTMRITMKDHQFGIDKDAMGKKCLVEGSLVSKKVDPERLKHFEEEGAEDHPEAGKEEAWSLVASSVAIARK